MTGNGLKTISQKTTRIALKANTPRNIHILISFLNSADKINDDSDRFFNLISLMILTTAVGNGVIPKISTVIAAISQCSKSKGVGHPFCSIKGWMGATHFLTGV
jgi:hypothetical protein